MNETIEDIARSISCCRLCRLSDTRINPVCGEGNIKTRIMFIGEAPGENEDKTGKPFAGKAGYFLTELIELAGLKREDVFIANILKCRPPKNRNPLPDEIEFCTQFLRKQIEIVKPSVICALGNFAMKYFMGEKYSISKLHGRFFNKNGCIVFPSYHPAASIYNPVLKNEMKNDFLKLKRFIKVKKIV